MKIGEKAEENIERIHEMLAKLDVMHGRTNPHQMAQTLQPKGPHDLSLDESKDLIGTAPGPPGPRQSTDVTGPPATDGDGVLGERSADSCQPSAKQAVATQPVP